MLPEHTALIYAMMTSVDENVGRLLRRLDELGLTKNTIVLFLSDNGPLFGGGGYEQAPRFNCGLRGREYEVYEGGIRVPLLVRWPGRLQHGREIDTPGAHIDLLPTLLDYAGIPPSDSPTIDGRSLRPLLENDGTAWTARTLFMSYPGEAGQHDAEPAPYSGGMAMDGRYKMIDGTELYDLQTDPGEATNPAEQEPETLRRLDTAYREFWAVSTSERAPHPPVHIGHSEENPTILTTHWAALDGGTAFQYTEDPPRYRSLGVHGDWIARWPAGGRATWRVDVQAAGRYRLGVQMHCTSADAGADLVAEIGDESLAFSFSGCADQQEKWMLQNLGAADLRTGVTNITLRTTQDTPGLIVRELVVEYLDRLMK